MGEKLIAIIAIGIVSAMFLGVLIYSELITDEKRFLITDLGTLNQTIVGQSFEYTSSPPNINVHFVELLPNAVTGWHTHASPLIVTVLHGEISVEYCMDEEWLADSSDKCPESQSIVDNYQTGDVFVEAINVLHNGINEGLIPVKVHVVTLNPGMD